MDTKNLTIHNCKNNINFDIPLHIDTTLTKISEILYKGNLRAVSKHIQSGVDIFTDAPKDNQGKGEAFSPTDLVATALGNCMITLMGITAKNHNFELGNVEAGISKIMDNNPRRIKEIVVELRIENLNFTEQQIRLLEYAAMNCPVAKSLSSDLQQTVSFRYY